MSNPILKIDHVSMKFGGLVAVDNLSFQAERGEITALIGPNGAGKTTVFNCITGFYKPTEGMMTLNLKNGEEFLLERMPDFEVNKKARVARTFQNIRLFSGLTLFENLLVAQHNTLMKASGYSVLGLLGFSSYKTASAQSVDKARYWLDRIGLTDRADRPAGDLPYGAQRRLEIARAMCTEPELLCLDEPAAGLNPRESAELNELLTSIPKETGTSILLIEHDMSVVMEISDHVVVLEYGRKISDGTPDHVKSDPKVIAAYLGVDDDEAEALFAKPASAKKTSIVPAASIMATAAVAGALKVATQPKAKAVPTTKSPAKAPAPKLAVAKPVVAKSVAVKPVVAKPVAVKSVSVKASVAKPIVAKPVVAKPVVAKPVVAKPAAIKPVVPAKLPDDLKRIKGIGPVNDAKLRAHGVSTFKQIAAWKKADIVSVEKYLEFDGRIAREDWMSQAKALDKLAPKPATKSKSGGGK